MCVFAQQFCNLLRTELGTASPTDLSTATSWRGSGKPLPARNTRETSQLPRDAWRRPHDRDRDLIGEVPPLRRLADGRIRAAHVITSAGSSFQVSEVPRG